MISSPGLRGKSLLLAFALAISFAVVHSYAGRPYTPHLGTQLMGFPIRFQDWTGEDRKISNEVLEKLGVDDHIMRLYSNGSDHFWLYIGYYRSQTGGKTIHSPKHCYPGSGWVKVHSEIRNYTIPGWEGEEISIPVNRYLLEKGGERELVYYWYQAGASVQADETRAILTRFLDSVSRNRSDGALIRISTRIPSGDRRADDPIAKVIPAIYALLKNHIPR